MRAHAYVHVGHNDIVHCVSKSFFVGFFVLGRFRLLSPDACHDRGAPIFCLILPLNLGAKDLSRKTNLEKNKTAINTPRRMKNPMAYEVHDENQ